MDRDVKLRILEELGGIPEEVYDSLVDEFFELVPDQLACLKDCASQQKWDELANVAHSVKGSAGNLRLNVVFEASRQIEMCGKDPQQRDLIEDRLGLLEEALRTFRPGTK